MNKAPVVEGEYYRVSEVRQILNISRDMVYALIYSGDLPHIALQTKKKKKYLIPKDRFREWLKTKESS